MSYSSLFIQLGRSQPMTYWTWLLNGMEWNTCLISRDNSVLSSHNDQTFSVQPSEIQTHNLHVFLPYFMPITTRCACIRQNNCQNILMGLLLADKNSLFWLDKHRKVSLGMLVPNSRDRQGKLNVFGKQQHVLQLQAINVFLPTY